MMLRASQSDLMLNARSFSFTRIQNRNPLRFTEAGEK